MKSMCCLCTSRVTILFYTISAGISIQELKDITIFRELLHKTGQRYKLTIGAPFKVVGDISEQTDNLRSWVLSELKEGQTKFR